MGDYVKVYLTDLELSLVKQLRDERTEDKEPKAAVNAILKEGLAFILVRDGLATLDSRGLLHRATQP